MTLTEYLGLKKPPSFADVLNTLGAGVISVITLWFGWAKPQAPPIPDNYEFFQLLCVSFAIPLAGALIIWRSSTHFRKWHVYTAAAIAVAIGAAGLLAYETARTERVASFTMDGKLYVRILAPVVASENVANRIRRLNICHGEGHAPNSQQISFKCAYYLARFDRERAADELFDHDALAQSEDMLKWRYRIGGLGSMIAIFLIADEIWRRLLAQMRAEAKRAKPATP